MAEARRTGCPTSCFPSIETTCGHPVALGYDLRSRAGEAHVGRVRRVKDAHGLGHANALVARVLAGKRGA